MREGDGGLVTVGGGGCLGAGTEGAEAATEVAAAGIAGAPTRVAGAGATTAGGVAMAGTVATATPFDTVTAASRASGAAFTTLLCVPGFGATGGFLTGSA